MQNKFPVTLLLLVFLVSMSANAYAKAWPGREERILGLGLKSTFPFDNFGDEVNTGLGLVGILDYPLIPLIDLTAEVGYSHFAGESGRASVDVWNICVGARFALGVFFMGGESGYFTYVDDASFIPSMGLRFGRFEGSVRHKAVGGSNWTSLRFGYYF